MTITYADRLSNGRQLPDVEIAELVYNAPVGGGGEWRHIAVVATILAESDGYEWVRPVVWKPGTVYHLSVDRGICQFNSARRADGTAPTYWADVPDHVAYDPEAAIGVMVAWLHTEAAKGTKGATVWGWTPLLDWQWHGFGGDRYQHELLGRARRAMNTVRNAHGLVSV